MRSFQGIACHWRNKMWLKKYHTWLSFYSLRCFSLSSSQSTSAWINLPLIPFLPVSNSHSYPIFSPFVFQHPLVLPPSLSYTVLGAIKHTCISVMAVVTCTREEHIHSLRLTILNNRNGNVTLPHILMLAWKCMQNSFLLYWCLCLYAYVCLCVRG